MKTIYIALLHVSYFFARKEMDLNINNPWGVTQFKSITNNPACRPNSPRLYRKEKVKPLKTLLVFSFQMTYMVARGGQAWLFFSCAYHS